MMKPLRSLLFVPGHKRDWIPKALASGADGVIIDLEDSVPEVDKHLARENAREAIAAHTGDVKLVVRPNGLATPHFAEDVRATALPGLSYYLLPMLESRDDVVAFDAVIAGGELSNGSPRGDIGVIASFETARSIQNAPEILSGPRVKGVMAAAAKDADIARSVGFRWTPEGTETLYLRSRLVVSARSAELDVIVLGLWQDVRDLEGLTSFATANVGLGFKGQVIIHPTHAAIVNSVYGLDAAEIDYYQRLIAAYEAGAAAGDGAVSFDGEHIDLAHAENARARLHEAGIRPTHDEEHGI